MIAHLAANLLVLVHFAFILFVATGGFLALCWRKIAYWHIPCVLWAILIEIGGWMCPLTPLEWYLWELAGKSGYTGGFIEHYILPLVYPPGLTRGMQIGFGVFILVLNLLVYGRMLMHWNRRRKDASKP